ncbi:MAG: ABC transporter ATP-binding protein [Bacteroidetes bacterium]|nr:ABC transporter ATP-binding protein [Bacteroidota bacterium]
MFSSLIKLRFLLDQRDVVQFGFLFAAILLMALLQVVGIASILPFMRLVAQPEVIDNNEWLKWIYTTFNFPSHQALLLASGIAVLLLLTISNAFAALTNWLQHKLAWSMAHNVSLRLVKTYAGLPYEFFLAFHSADLIRKVISEVNDLITGVLLAGIEFAAQMIVAIVILGLLVLVHPTLALTGFGVFGGVYGLIYLIRHAYITRLGQERIDANDVRYKTFVEMLTGIKAVKTEGAQRYFINRFDSASRQYSRIHPRFHLVSNAPGYFIETMAFGGILLAILYLLAGDQNLLAVLPTLSMFTLGGYRLLPSLNKAFVAAARVRHTYPVIDDIFKDLEKPDQWRARADVVPCDPVTLNHCITLENVSFKYKNSDVPVLRDIDITIPRKAKIAFVGPTGCGKTTLVDIIIGLLVSYEGRLLVDGTPITQHNTMHWQREIGYVPQDVFLYDDTVARNIAFGVQEDEMDVDRIRAAATTAQIDRFIVEELPDGYDTKLGERGVRLSGGQRQRVGLARALYRQPNVLILDEATSALDGITEEAVIRAIRDQAPGLTVIMVAHRLSTVKWCERIYLLEHGRIVEHGSYEELFVSSSKFREMVKLTS